MTEKLFSTHCEDCGAPVQVTESVATGEDRVLCSKCSGYTPFPWGPAYFPR